MCLFIYLLPFVVLISREIVCPRRWRRSSTKYTRVDKLLDCWRSGTKDVNQRQKNNFPWQRPNMLGNGQISKNYWPLEVGKNHSSEWSILQHWEELCNHFRSWPLLSIYNECWRVDFFPLIHVFRITPQVVTYIVTYKPERIRLLSDVNVFGRRFLCWSTLRMLVTNSLVFFGK